MFSPAKGDRNYGLEDMTCGIETVTMIPTQI